MRAKVNTPNFEDIFPYNTFAGIINYRNQEFKYIFCKNGSSLALFVFDPQTDGITLTNASDFILERIAQELVSFGRISENDLFNLFSVGNIALRDSYGDWSQVKVSITTATTRQNNLGITGAKVKQWKHLDVTPEFLELFKLLG